MRVISIARLVVMIGFCGLVLWGLSADPAQAQASSSVRSPPPRPLMVPFLVR